MEESSQNKYRMNNNDEIYLNDVVMEEERMEKEYEIQPSLQIEENIDANEGKDKMKEIFKKKLKKWRR
jgi:LEA14-like dessication related protein